MRYKVTFNNGYEFIETLVDKIEHLKDDKVKLIGSYTSPFTGKVIPFSYELSNKDIYNIEEVQV